MLRKRNGRKLPHSGERGEQCMNPWNGECLSSEVMLYIYYKGRQLPICRSCWAEIVERDVEWS